MTKPIGSSFDLYSSESNLTTSDNNHRFPKIKLLRVCHISFIKSHNGILVRRIP